jgi:hypothetical protein
MKYNSYQSIEDIIKSATPEQRILWQQVLLIAGEQAPVRQLFYQGAAAGSEFLTYSPNKLYLALDLSGNLIAAQASFGSFLVHDETNTGVMYYGSIYPVWNTTGAAVWSASTSQENRNFYFSRLIVTGYTFIKFIGYKIGG